MNVLIGCEYTAIGRDAFRKRGHNAWSCDLDPTEGDPEFHYQCDIFKALDKQPWDLIIIHIDCTRMAVCGNKHHAGTKGREQDIDWSLKLWQYAKNVCDRVCFENPMSVIHPVLRKHGADTQYVQPYQFGHPETKNTGLSKINLPDLVETDNVYDYMMTLPKKERHKIWYASPSETRGKDRSRSFPGIMEAMADQWGSL